MLRLLCLLLCSQLSYQLECLQCHTTTTGQFSGATLNNTDMCSGYEDLGKKVTCEDPKAYCYQEYYYRDMFHDGRPQKDVMKWDLSDVRRPNTPHTMHPGYESHIP